ncbi:MAG: hypothetical protein EON56_02865 [Alphaproteobacteria bacterium]|nr:MAG: hypothetical protein EON56_02865 [Alphaproteobacteria bacterium]
MMTSSPLLIPPDEVLDIKTASHRVKRSVDQVRRWHKEHGIGRQAGPNAPIEISAPALCMVQHGDFSALDELKAGHRDSDRVVRYLDFLGLPR